MDTTKNIISGRPATSYDLLPNSEDQIPQLTQRTLDLIKQAINLAVAQLIKVAINKALDQRFRQECRRPAIELNDPATHDIRDIPEKDWRLEEIGFFDPNWEEPDLVVTVNHRIYYRDVYAFVDELKDIALL